MMGIRWIVWALGLLALLPGSLLAPQNPDESGPAVVADFAPLRRALVLSISDNIFRSSEAAQGRHAFFASGLPRGAIREHAALVQLLKQQGVEVLDVRDLLQSALEQARQKGELQEWLRAHFPATAERAAARLEEVDADALLARRNEFFYAADAEGDFSPVFSGFSSMYWARDFAISTPKGVILGHSRHHGRVVENAVARLLFEFAPKLSDFPIAFDARREGIYLDGGDLIVLDPRTLLLGVGNRTSREAAPLLAKRLQMTVLAVDLPSLDAGGGLRRQLLHLDSFFNLIDDRTVLAVPYFLEKKYSDSHPLAGVLRGIARQVERMEELQPEYELANAEAIRATAEAIPAVGWVTRFEAGTGEAQPTEQKLVDYFRSRGYRVIMVGGEPNPEVRLPHLLERALYELRWQGANVVQLAPGKVIAYEHNVHTNRALRQAGVEVLTVPGELLSFRNGGPHCLLMPLVRKE